VTYHVCSTDDDHTVMVSEVATDLEDALERVRYELDQGHGVDVHRTDRCYEASCGREEVGG
jgi:hypothetical protein